MIDIIQQKELINLQVKYQQQQLLIYSTLFSSANKWSIETNFNSSLIKANQQKL